MSVHDMKLQTPTPLWVKEHVGRDFGEDILWKGSSTQKTAKGELARDNRVGQREPAADPSASPTICFVPRCTPRLQHLSVLALLPSIHYTVAPTTTTTIFYSPVPKLYKTLGCLTIFYLTNPDLPPSPDDHPSPHTSENSLARLLPCAPPLPSFASNMMATQTASVPPVGGQPFVSKWSSRYRGATVEDLDPPIAMSLTPKDPISWAIISAFERDYTHLTIVDGKTRALLGYIAIPLLQEMLDSGRVTPQDAVSKAMVRFQRKGPHKYKTITMDTPLEELEEFFEGGCHGGQKQEFAVITDEMRRFVLGVATRSDLEEFVKRRPE
ncbi:hypothetical protein MKZ38_010134 [Zalerion maritima]|uniref:CBS domain-containing protein n=1 Tax=Zalerion maritima TaxID=339359 RepID=A0AAD5RG82_9PEZI|nr:hypothetical protein MKZ38_010134 [Zalerion maritima]